MFSPAKAVAAGAVVFAIGGALLLVQPFGGQPATAPGAESADGPSAVGVTGRFSFGSALEPGVTVRVGDRRESRGTVQLLNIENISDPRLDGTLTIADDSDSYVGSDGGVYAFGVTTYRIENDAGSWQGSAPYFMDRPRASAKSSIVLTGEDAYEGLYAILSTDWNDVTGVIFPGPPPEAPAVP